MHIILVRMVHGSWVHGGSMVHGPSSVPRDSERFLRGLSGPPPALHALNLMIPSYNISNSNSFSISSQCLERMTPYVHSIKYYSDVTPPHGRAPQNHNTAPSNQLIPVFISTDRCSRIDGGDADYYYYSLVFPGVGNSVADIRDGKSNSAAVTTQSFHRRIFVPAAHHYSQALPPPVRGWSTNGKCRCRQEVGENNNAFIVVC
jgi:hypothetical protein